MTGFEPVFLPWKGSVGPLNYTRKSHFLVGEPGFAVHNFFNPLHFRTPRSDERKLSRRAGIRTRDLTVPNGALYQLSYSPMSFSWPRFILPAELLSDNCKCRGWDSNPHGPIRPQDFKSCAYTIPPPRLEPYILPFLPFRSQLRKL